MSADRNRNRTRPPSFIGTLGIQPHVVGGNDVDARKVLLLDHEPIHSGVEAELRVFCDHDAGRDHRTTVVDGRHWYRKAEEIDRVADLDDFFVGSGLGVSRFDWMFNAVLQLGFDFTVRLTTHRHDGACAGSEYAGNDRNVIADHIVKHQSCLCLIHQGSDMPDVYRLPDVGKLVFLPESFEQIAEGFFRVLLRGHTIYLDSTRLLHYPYRESIFFSHRDIFHGAPENSWCLGDVQGRRDAVEATLPSTQRARADGSSMRE